MTPPLLVHRGARTYSGRTATISSTAGEIIQAPEAAQVDGAGFWRTLFQITIPMMLPIINVAVLFGIIFTFTDMTVVYILTRGGPYDTTQVLPSLLFFTGVLGGDLAAGAAISLFLVPVLVVVAILMLRMAHRAGARRTRHGRCLAATSRYPRHLVCRFRARGQVHLRAGGGHRQARPGAGRRKKSPAGHAGRRS
jgi:hypothetical protein